MNTSIRRVVSLVIATQAVLVVAAANGSPADTRTVTSLGRIEPRDGVIRVSGPSGPSAVIAELYVAEGDRVEAGQKLAVLDSFPLNKAERKRLEAVLENAERELARTQRLARNSAVSDSEQDEARLGERVARAELEASAARLEMSIVRAPIAGQVLYVHARAGEQVGPEGVVELGDTTAMYVVAEVYETEIGLVRTAQRATITSTALSRPVSGVVERIGLKVGKMDLFDTDPVARTDARVVEVHIRLDENEEVSRLTNLQVHVEIHP